MKMCFNRNVLIGLGVVAAGILVVAPQAFLPALPVLVVLACPLSMVFMMRAMSGPQSAEISSTEPSTTIPAGSADVDAAEVTRLRAEIDQLRASLRDRRQDQPTTPDHPVQP